MSVEIAAGSTESISIRLTQAGSGVTGATIKVKIQRKDGLWLDWADSTFKALGSVGTLQQTMPAVTGDASRYAYSWNTSTIANPAASDVYTYTVSETAPTSRPELCTDEIRTGLFAVVGVLPTAAAIASAVWAVTDGTLTKGAALDLLRRRVTNKRVLSLLGVLSFYADDGTTVEKTSTVADVVGTHVTPLAGEASQASAES